jgi:hypothetical protein
MFLCNLLPKPKVPQLPVCSKSKEGNQTLYRKVSGDDGVVICIKNNGQYIWKFLDGKIVVFFKLIRNLVLRLDILFLTKFGRIRTNSGTRCKVLHLVVCVTGNKSSKTNTMPSTMHCMKYAFRTRYRLINYSMALLHSWSSVYKKLSFKTALCKFVEYFKISFKIHMNEILIKKQVW